MTHFCLTFTGKDGLRRMHRGFVHGGKEFIIGVVADANTRTFNPRALELVERNAARAAGKLNGTEGDRSSS